MQSNHDSRDIRPKLEIRDLSCGYRNRDNYREILRNVDFHVNKGEMVGVIGEIGSGKTTMIRAIEGKIYRSSGDILYDGESIFSGKNFFKFRKRRVVVRQDSLNALRPRYSVEFQMRKLFRGGKLDMEDVERSFRYLGLSMDIMEKLPVQLSDGTRHRVLIAMASIVKPDILIVDEPTAGLDTLGIKGMLRLFREMSSSTSIIIVSSDIIPVFQACDRIYVMRNGQILEDGKWHDLLEKPHHPYLKDLMNSVPSVKNRDRECREVNNENTGGCVYSGKCRYVNEKCSHEIPYMTDGDHGYRCINYPEWYSD
ncbi:MAG: ATP-binding cassette domain-containing protein [Candidatus Thermoplasmatota archaeon]|jgi:oligopeptide/dipeptide ABC transporter ATP-binding protein|nr:ATP-binding cassette domain-containing protein [Candidatus Thermoplasmatota archaeon]MCL5791054.1 ATP-binding cassette domain-containing protein [Candidatus Thermoplasmatota archaeon]